MRSSATSAFWALYEKLPIAIQKLARKQFRLWMADPRHPSVNFKKVGLFWSARVSDSYRALCILRGDTYYWFWIGTHAEYDQILKGK